MVPSYQKLGFRLQDSSVLSTPQTSYRIRFLPQLLLEGKEADENTSPGGSTGGPGVWGGDSVFTFRNMGLKRKGPFYNEESRVQMCGIKS